MTKTQKQALNMEGIPGQDLENPLRLDEEWKGEQRGSSTMAPTGKHQAVADRYYDLISVAYHALQAVETYQQYCDDAEQAGDKDLKEFFEQCIEQNQRTAARAQELIFQRGQSGGAQREPAAQDQPDTGIPRH